MNLKMKIRNVKSINELVFEFPLEAGIYAITGENGSGKSTLISCASTVFYSMPMNEFFGRPSNASIEFYLEGASRKWECNGKTWSQESSKDKIENLKIMIWVAKSIRKCNSAGSENRWRLAGQE